MRKQTAKQLAKSVLASTMFAAPLMLSPCLAQAGIVNQPDAATNFTDANTPIDVTQTGRLVPAAGVPVTFSGAGSVLSLREGNEYFQTGTIFPTGTVAVLVDTTASGSSLTFNPVTSVLGAATQNTIQILGATTTLTNSGHIGHQAGSDGKITVLVGGGPATNTTIINMPTGLIDNDPNGTDNVLNTTTGGAANNLLLLNNQGRIVNQGKAGSSAVNIEGGFTEIINSGFIEQTTATETAAAVILNPSLESGTFTNTETGTIWNTAADGTGNTVEIRSTAGATLGTFTNAGLIENKSTAGGSAIFIDGGTQFNLTQFDNTGVIINQNKGAGTPTLKATGTVLITNGINNNTGGSIVAGDTTLSAVDLSGITPDAADAGAVFNNAGDVVGNVLLAPNGPGNTATVFNSTDGTISGGVFAAGTSSTANVLNVTGGTIRSIENTADAGVTPNTYNLSGGTVVDYLHLPNVAGNVVNLSGTDMGTILGGTTAGDIFNITGGSFFALDGNTGASTVNINATFETNGEISNIPVLNINGAGTVFTANNKISGIDATSLNVGVGTTFIPNNIVEAGAGVQAVINVNGTLLVNTANTVFDFSNSTTSFTSVINNNGLTQIGTEGVLRILGNWIGNTEGGNPLFVSDNGGTLNVQIYGPPGCTGIANGQMIVDSFANGNQYAVELRADSFLHPEFTGFLPGGQTIDIITVYTGGENTAEAILNDSTLVPYQSAVISFVPAVVQTGTGIAPPPPDPEYTSILRLTVDRRTYLSLSSTGVTPGVAQTLDAFANPCPPTNDIYTLLSALDQIPTQLGVEQAMESLTPGFNYGLIAGSNIGMNSVFEAITDRVFELVWTGNHHQLRFPNRTAQRFASGQDDAQNFRLAMGSGDNFGDEFSTSGVWIRPIGAYLTQDSREGVAGYLAKGYGLAMGIDWGINECTTYGVALSYTKVNVDDRAFAPKNDDIKSWQGTLYGFYDFSYGMYFNAIAAFAHNNYHSNRVIHAHDFITTATGSFTGNQWGIQGDLGRSIPNQSCYFFAPFVRLKYINVNFDEYTETDAGDLNLRVNYKNSSEFLGGIGFRTALDFMSGGVEWVPELMAMIAYDFYNNGQQSTGAMAVGPAFDTNGIAPGRTIFDLGLALNAVCGTSVTTVKYNLELRDKFVGNAAYLQYYLNWG